MRGEGSVTKSSESIRGGFVPACMTDDELSLWSRETGSANRPCVDCPATFEAEMLEAGRCNATPHKTKRRRIQAVERTRLWKARLRSDVQKRRSIVASARRTLVRNDRAGVRATSYDSVVGSSDTITDTMRATPFGSLTLLSGVAASGVKTDA